MPDNESVSTYFTVIYIYVCKRLKKISNQPAFICKSVYYLLVCDKRNINLQLCEWLLCSLRCQFKMTLDSGKCSASAVHMQEYFKNFEFKKGNRDCSLP